MSWVAILMGSQSDWSAMESATEVLGDLGIEFEVRVSSAHRTPRETAAYVDDADSRGCGVFICGAGLAAHLAGAVAAHTTRPVIGVQWMRVHFPGLTHCFRRSKCHQAFRWPPLLWVERGPKMRVIWLGRSLPLATRNSPSGCRKIGRRIGRKWRNKIVRFRRPWTASE